MKQSEIQDFAREYIDRALESQRELGYSNEVSSDEYDRAVDEAAIAFGTLLALGNGNGTNGANRAPTPITEPSS